MARTCCWLLWMTTSSDSRWNTIQITVLIRNGLSTPRSHPRGIYSHPGWSLRLGWTRRGLNKWHSSPISLYSTLSDTFPYCAFFLFFLLLQRVTQGRPPWVLTNESYFCSVYYCSIQSNYVYSFFQSHKWIGSKSTQLYLQYPKMGEDDVYPACPHKLNF